MQKQIMASARFARCFPLGDGNICCEHWNGSYIVFRAYNKLKNYINEKSPKVEDDSEEETS